MARERGMTAADVARRLKLYRSNLSAIDAGRRSLSLRALGRIADVLSCSPGELLERVDAVGRSVFRQSHLNVRLAERDATLVDGAERTWVHATLLAWQRHYRAPRSFDSHHGLWPWARSGFRPIPRPSASGSCSSGAWPSDPEPQRGTGAPKSTTGFPRRGSGHLRPTRDPERSRRRSSERPTQWQ